MSNIIAKLGANVPKVLITAGASAVVAGLLWSHEVVKKVAN